MCTVFAVRDPNEVTGEEWKDIMFPALTSENYVTGSFAARVYGIDQLPDYQDIPDGSEAAVLVSTQCSTAMRTAEETTGSLGIRLMVRLGMEDTSHLKDHQRGINHGQLPWIKERKFAYYSVVVPNRDWLGDIVNVVYDVLPYGQEMIRIFREDGGDYIGRTNSNDRLGSLLLDFLIGRRSKSEQYLIKSSVENLQDGIANWHRLQAIRGIETVIAFIEA